jgi:hypothetical protein
MGVRAGCAAALLSFCWYQQPPNKKHYQTIKHFALLTTRAKRDREGERIYYMCASAGVQVFNIASLLCCCTESRCISGDRSERSTQYVSSSPEKASVLSIMHFAIAANVFANHTFIIQVMSAEESHNAHIVMHFKQTAYNYWSSKIANHLVFYIVNVNGSLSCGKMQKNIVFLIFLIKGSLWYPQPRLLNEHMVFRVFKNQIRC